MAGLFIENRGIELLTNNDKLLMAEKGIRAGICHAVHKYAKANTKYMNNYDKRKESSFIEYLGANNLYEGAMSQKLPVDGFKWIETYLIDKNFCKFVKLIKNYEHPKNLHDLHSDLPFLSERTKINKCSKLICNLYDKKNYVAHIRSLKQALNHGLIFKKVHRVIQFNQKAWLQEYIDMNTKLRKQAKIDFEQYLFKIMNNPVFGKTMENVRKQRDMELVTTEEIS